MSSKSVFPMRPPVDAPEREARTVDLFTEEGERMLDALGSGTSRAIMAALADEPATTSDLADRVDTSIQNAHYHVERLAAVGLVRAVDTHYSARGSEMDVYAPAHDPLVLVGGGEDARGAVAETAGEPAAGAPRSSD